jgi:hypothetical protein
MALVLAETAAGSVALLFLTPLWDEVRRGFFVLTGCVLALVGASAWWSVVAGTTGDGAAGRWGARLVLAFTALTVLWVGLLLARRAALARALGLASVPIAAAVLVLLAITTERGTGVALFQLFAGGAFLGATTMGLLLGHWYLTDRSLSRAPIQRLAVVLIVAVALELVAVLLGGFGSTEAAASARFNPLLTSAGGLASWIALGMVLTTGLIAVLIRIALRGQRASAVQAATGFFYLALITAFTADLAARVRFLPAG